ncbi:unnamed protein product, partial [Closterium sp. NIES-54]
KDFNEELRRCDHDLAKWRATFNPSDDDMAVLDANGGVAWQLAQQLLRKRPNHEEAVWPSGGCRVLWGVCTQPCSMLLWIFCIHLLAALDLHFHSSSSFAWGPHSLASSHPIPPHPS